MRFETWERIESVSMRVDRPRRDHSFSEAQRIETGPDARAPLNFRKSSCGQRLSESIDAL
jgi:hypothetical protein